MLLLALWTPLGEKYTHAETVCGVLLFMLQSFGKEAFSTPTNIFVYRVCRGAAFDHENKTGKPFHLLLCTNDNQ